MVQSAQLLAPFPSDAGRGKSDDFTARSRAFDMGPAVEQFVTACRRQPRWGLVLPVGFQNTAHGEACYHNCSGDASERVTYLRR